MLTILSRAGWGVFFALSTMLVACFSIAQNRQSQPEANESHTRQGRPDDCRSILEYLAKRAELKDEAQQTSEELQEVNSYLAMDDQQLLEESQGAAFQAKFKSSGYKANASGSTNEEKLQYVKKFLQEQASSIVQRSSSSFASSLPGEIEAIRAWRDCMLRKYQAPRSTGGLTIRTAGDPISENVRVVIQYEQPIGFAGTNPIIDKIIADEEQIGNIDSLSASLENETIATGATEFIVARKDLTVPADLFVSFKEPWATQYLSLPSKPLVDEAAEWNRRKDTAFRDGASIVASQSGRKYIRIAWVPPSRDRTLFDEKAYKYILEWSRNADMNPIIGRADFGLYQTEYTLTPGRWKVLYKAASDEKAPAFPIGMPIYFRIRFGFEEIRGQRDTRKESSPGGGTQLTSGVAL